MGCSVKAAWEWNHDTQSLEKCSNKSRMWIRIGPYSGCSFPDPQWSAGQTHGQSRHVVSSHFKRSSIYCSYCSIFHYTVSNLTNCSWSDTVLGSASSVFPLQKSLSATSSFHFSRTLSLSGTSMGSIVRLGEAGRQGQWHDWWELQTGGRGFSCGSLAQPPVSGRDATAPPWWPWSGRRRSG